MCCHVHPDRLTRGREEKPLEKIQRVVIPSENYRKYMESTDVALALEACEIQLRIVANIISQVVPSTASQWHDVINSCKRQADVAERALAHLRGREVQLNGKL